MKIKSFILLIIMTLSLNVVAQELADWWNDVSVYAVNKMQARTNVIPYQDENGIDNLEYRESPYYQCINGNWKFNWVERPADKPVGFYAEGYDVSSWGNIIVPGNWEMNGYGVPVYVNQTNEFPSNQPYAPTEYNPVGCYVHTFNVPEKWEGRNVYINFGAVKSAFYLWINGQFVGYSEDSKTPAEFDITPYLKKGDNKLAVEAYRFSDGSYLECQDYWRMSGITRDVFIYSKPKTNIYDFFVKAGLDETYSKGVFDIAIDLNYVRRTTFNLEIEILSNEGAKTEVKELYTEKISRIDLKKTQKQKGLSTIHINKIIDKVKQMNLFQKVLLISALIPYYSCVIVNLVTYVVCWKKKLSFFPFVICFFAYAILMSLVINCSVLPIIKYIVSVLIALVGNYCLISLQMRD